jgi:Domain of unknown function (DUF4395)
MIASLSFPNPVNEVTARVTAGGVALLTVIALATQQRWLTILLAVGFLLRVIAGPKLSPLALLASRVVVPRLPWAPRMVAGPPKRFAQAIGLSFSLAAALLFYVFSLSVAGDAVLGALLLAALLESVLGLCLGCRAFALLMRAGVIPSEVCERCNDIWAGRTPPHDGGPAPAPASSPR